MIDGISKLLNVATTMEQTIECHKALVLSQQRMLAFMAEIQRKQMNLLKSDEVKYVDELLFSSVMFNPLEYVAFNQPKQRFFSRIFVYH